MFMGSKAQINSNSGRFQTRLAKTSFKDCTERLDFASKVNIMWDFSKVQWTARLDKQVLQVIIECILMSWYNI
jgi:hypothetical protein